MVRVTPRRLSIPFALYVLLTCAAIAFFISFGKEFPPRMALHFTSGGIADGYIDRVKFIVLGSFLSLMLPTFIVAMIGVLPRILPASALMVPNKAYWAAPERRVEALDTMLWFALCLACLMQVFLLLISIGIYRSNLSQPPAFGASAFFVWLPAVVLAVGVARLIVVLFRAFNIPRANLR